MSEPQIRLLYIEDDAGLGKHLEQRLQRHGYQLEWIGDGISGLERMQSGEFDVVAIDYEMPGLNGLAVLERMQSLDNPPPAIMISGADLDTAIAAMRVGAADYVVKTPDGSYMELLPRTIERVLEKQRLEAQAIAAQRALEEKNQLLSLTLGSINQGLSVFDSNLRLVAWNKLWFDLFDYPIDLAVAGTPHAAFVEFRSKRDVENSEASIAEMIRLARDGEPQVAEYRLHNGKTMEIRSSGMPYGGVVTVYTDVTARKRAEEELRVAAAVFQASAEPMLITDAQFQVERCNPAFEDLLGYSSNEVVGRDPATFFAEQKDAVAYEDVRRELREEGHWRGRVWSRHKEGALLAQQVTVSAIHNDSGQVGHFVAVYIDVTEQVLREEQVRHQANHDELTGLPNRNLLLDRMEHAIETARRERAGFSVLFIDLDGFKPVNDEYGHRAGDLLLKEIARRLLVRCRESDTVARYGGDEFIVLLRNTSEVQAVGAVAAVLLEEVAKPVRVDDVSHEVQASIGIALFPHHAHDASALLRMADQAMYQAKEAGKACCRFYDGTD